MKVAVVGAGIAGSSVARTLAQRGVDVTLFDQFPQGHTRGSSHGRSRIIRRAYPDPFYTEIMGQGYPLWRELERASGESIVSEVGLLYFGRETSDDLTAMVEGLQALQVPHEVLNQSQMKHRFPAFRTRSGEIGIFTPEAGYVHADRAVSATRSLAVQAGCKTQNNRVSPSGLDLYDQVVVCPGPWVRDWWPDAPVKVTLQTVAYIQGDLEGPVWIEDGPDFLYGFPSTGGEGYKIGVHSHGPEIEPNNPQRTPDPRQIDLIQRFAHDRLGIDSPVMQEQVACLYTNAPNDDFLIHRPDSRTTIVSACSGHGFKFGPWLGRLIADVVEGKEDLKRYAVFIK